MNRRTADSCPSFGRLCLPVLFVLILVISGLLTGCAQGDARNAYKQGCEALENEQFAEAIEFFQTAIDNGFYLSEAYRGIGLAYLEQTSYADAAIAFERSLLNVEEQDEAYQRDVNLYLAFCRERQGQDDKVMEIYNELIKKVPDAETLFLRGRLHLRQESDRAARNDFDQAVSLSPDYDLYINIYQCYADEEKSGDGSRYLEEALKIAKSNADDYYNQGLVEFYLQNYSDAREMLIQALRRSPDDGKSVFLLGKIYLATEDVANARALYKEYVGRDGTTAGACNGLALCDIAEGNYESALTYIQQGLETGDAEARQGLLYNEIVVYEYLHDWATASSKAASYVLEYPGDEAGLREYEFLQTR